VVEDRVGVGGGSARIRPEDGTVRYRIELPVVHHADLTDLRQREGRLYVAISDYTGPGDYAPDAVIGELTLRGGESWAHPGDYHYALSGCHATVGEGDAEGRLECDVGGEATSGGASASGRLTATWQAESVGREVGDPVEVTWLLGDHYRSQGIATVYRLVGGSQVPGAYEIPRVRVGGTPATPEVLRLLIAPYAGDATYTGDAITAMLDNVTGESPQVVDGRHRPDIWTPVFGACQAVVRDEGRSGEINCPGAAPDNAMFPGGSTTLTATWRVLGP
jgi:hypothetical protein